MRRMILLLLVFPIVIRADGSTLFDSDEPLSIVLEFPVRTVVRQAENRPVVDGMARYRNLDGETVSLPVQISSRGKSRLEACKFPPLSLAVKKKSAKGTVFEGQKSLKVVTHCRSSADFRSYVRQEYGIYEAFNVLTDVSFRARHINVTYRDTEKAGAEIQEQGFLIESIGEVAKRTNLERQRVTRVKTAQVDPRYATLSALFNFMVGNTDWSVKLSPEESDCCHNGRVLSQPGETTGWKVVPYDFDQAGIINTRYACRRPSLVSSRSGSDCIAAAVFTTNSWMVSSSCLTNAVRDSKKRCCSPAYEMKKKPPTTSPVSTASSMTRSNGKNRSKNAAWLTSSP